MQTAITCFRRRRGRRAFTLIELLVVVAIIALLVSILVPSLGKAKELARRAKCQGNLHLMGRGWHAYWTGNNYRYPSVSLGERTSSGGNPAYDSQSQYNDRLSGAWRNITGAGFLWKSKFVTERDAFICPTIELNVARPWFDENWSHGGFWPPGSGNLHSKMTYGMRRMGNYDEARLADVDRWNISSSETDDIMLMKCGVEKIKSGSGFSFMGDSFVRPAEALTSHVPGVEMLYLDGHVKWFQDYTEGGDILYWGNGIGYNLYQNWLHDDIWMIIDGFHKLPVGQ